MVVLLDIGILAIAVLAIGLLYALAVDHRGVVPLLAYPLEGAE
jgi:hypothetical protein